MRSSLVSADTMVTNSGVGSSKYWFSSYFAILHPRSIRYINFGFGGKIRKVYRVSAIWIHGAGHDKKGGGVGEHHLAKTIY